MVPEWIPIEDGQPSPSYQNFNYDAPNTHILEIRDHLTVGSIRIGMMTLIGSVHGDLTMHIETTDFFRP